MTNRKPRLASVSALLLWLLAAAWPAQQAHAQAPAGGATGGAPSPPVNTERVTLCSLTVGPTPAKICEGGSFPLTASLTAFFGGTSTAFTVTQTGPTGTTVASGPNWLGTINLPLPGPPLPPGTYNYVLTLSDSSCSRSSAFTVQVMAKPNLGTGTAKASEACSWTDPNNFQTSVANCCGCGLKLQVGPPAVGTVTWEYSPPPGSVIAGAVGATTNINPTTPPLACPVPATPFTIQAVAATDPVCPTVTSNPITETTFPTPSLGSVNVTPAVLCADGTSKATICASGVVGTLSWIPPSGPPTSNACVTVGPFTSPPLPPPPTYTEQVTSGPFTSGPCAPLTRGVSIGLEQPLVGGSITANLPTVCPGGASRLTLAGETANSNVKWYSAPGPCTSVPPCTATPPPPWAAIPGATGKAIWDTNNLNSTQCYCAVVSSPDGACPAVASGVAQVTVNPLPSAPSVSCPAILCPGGHASFVAAPPSQPGVTYAWSCNAPGLPLPPATVGPPNTLTTTVPENCWVTASNGCASFQSNVCPLALDPLAVEIKGLCCACNGKPVQLCAVVHNGTALSYSWSPGGQTTQCITVTPTATTSYTVTVSDTFHCNVAATFTVTVCH